MMGLLDNPLLQMGLGILSANTHGQSFGGAMAGGMNNLMQMRAYNEQKKANEIQEKMQQMKLAAFEKEQEQLANFKNGLLGNSSAEGPVIPGRGLLGADSASLLAQLPDSMLAQVMPKMIEAQMGGQDVNMPADYNAYIATLGPEKGKQAWMDSQRPAPSGGQVVYTDQGIMSYNNGTLTPLMVGGKPVTQPQYTPEVIAPVEQAKKEGQGAGDLSVNFEDAKRSKDRAISQLDILKNNVITLRDHKGLDGITGAVYGATQSFSDESLEAEGLHEQLMGGMFTQAMAALKDAAGSIGPVTEKEGAKIEASFASLRRRQSKDSWIKNANKLIEILDQSKASTENAFSSKYRKQLPSSPADLNGNEPTVLRIRRGK
jgi:hypothetical protein